jgi:hypothetical protein
MRRLRRLSHRVRNPNSNSSSAPGVATGHPETSASQPPTQSPLPSTRVPQTQAQGNQINPSITREAQESQINPSIIRAAQGEQIAVALQGVYIDLIGPSRVGASEYRDVITQALNLRQSLRAPAIKSLYVVGGGSFVSLGGQDSEDNINRLIRTQIVANYVGKFCQYSSTLAFPYVLS